MLALLTSTSAIYINGAPINDIVQSLVEIAKANPVYVVSNQPKPAWFDGLFSGSNVQFLQWVPRQDGKIISAAAEHYKLQSHDVIVLAANSEDIQMAKNGGAVLVAAGWSNDRRVGELGIKVSSRKGLEELIALTNGWAGDWWFTATDQSYSVRALVDLSSYNRNIDQQMFAKMLTSVVKGGGSKLTALLTVAARSLLIDGLNQLDDLFWGIYPSSSSANNDTEILSDFTHRLRTTVSQVRFAKRNSPLFIRHTASEKRSVSRQADRTDPTGQVTTIHLNPEYKGKLKGRNVIVIDDCTTYGVSFGVAAAFLRKAGAASVSGVALGKFGNSLNYYDINITADPYAPVAASGFTLNATSQFTGKSNNVSQNILQSLIS